MPVKEYPQFAAGLSFLAHLTPIEALGLLKERSGTLAKQIQDVHHSMETTRAMGIDRLFIIEQEYSLALLEAEQKWLPQLMNDIENGVLAERKEDEWNWIVHFQKPPHDV
jgi:hypothetical protein